MKILLTCVLGIFWLAFSLFIIIRPRNFYALAYRGDFKPNEKLMVVFYRIMGSVSLAAELGIVVAYFFTSPGR